ncbi:hypothetical protein GVAV_002913 [Gurleya vavrai]
MVKHRRRTSKMQLKVLEKTFETNVRPDAAMRKILGEQLGMTPRSVQVWFQNRRAKIKKIKTPENSQRDYNEKYDAGLYKKYGQSGDEYLHKETFFKNDEYEQEETDQYNEEKLIGNNEDYITEGDNCNYVNNEKIFYISQEDLNDRVHCSEDQKMEEICYDNTNYNEGYNYNCEKKIFYNENINCKNELNDAESINFLYDSKNNSVFDEIESQHEGKNLFEDGHNIESVSSNSKEFFEEDALIKQKMECINRNSHEMNSNCYQSRSMENMQSAMYDNENNNQFIHRRSYSTDLLYTNPNNFYSNSSKVYPSDHQIFYNHVNGYENKEKLFRSNSVYMFSPESQPKDFFGCIKNEKEIADEEKNNCEEIDTFNPYMNLM